jgi:DNA-binding NarL/FixJ family response regulator
LNVSDRTAIIVDREQRWLDAVGTVLEKMPVKVVGKTSSLSDAAELVDKLDPDLVIVDVGMRENEATGLSWISSMRASHKDLKVVALSAGSDRVNIGAVLAAGVDAYLIKKADPNEIAVAVRQVYERSFYLPADTAKPSEAASLKRSGLTQRELHILRFAADGFSNVEIAKQLWVTEQTVKFHLSNIYRKLGVANRTQAARQAHLLNLLSATDPERHTRPGH